ncbi:LamG-like jellyroll fold domain-containing protein [Dolichospermum sp. UHCC 0259]|uniref:LamG-like jellyroll fold domain-containing protein n=1 Tax=Dolichospermum sp. UHCC 0259 TaxID=2590010 RepID=UPI0014468821|nr:LamG-like jellyroll fold domain-containing protein [Dolichospermum sp. UHCC 0259]MTJ47294.1 hypothetical protein [Dolichospermum sp. UHCC 0259]
MNNFNILLNNSYQVLFPNLDSILNQALQNTSQYLSQFRDDAGYTQKLETAFGTDFDEEVANQLFNTFAEDDFSAVPTIEVVNSNDINSANGAFSITTGKIYLAAEFISQNAENLDAVVAVLLEETGHFIDARINKTDATGDEGDIFARLLQGKNISQEKLAVLQAEDDTVTVTLDDQEIEIEQAISNNINVKVYITSITVSEENGAEIKFKYEATIPLSGIAANIPDIDIKYNYYVSANDGSTTGIQPTERTFRLKKDQETNTLNLPKIDGEDDKIYEPKQTFTFELKESSTTTSSATYNVKLDTNNPDQYSRTLTIDNEPLISIENNSNFTEGGGNGEFIINLDKTPPQNFNLYFQVEGTAKWGEGKATKKGSDYKLIYQGYDLEGKIIDSFKVTSSPSDINTNGVYSISNIPTSVKQIKITVEQVNDEVWEGNETVTITLLDNQKDLDAEGTNNLNDGYGVDSTKATATVTIFDNEPTVTLGKVVNPTEGFGFGSTIEGLGAALNLNSSNSVTIPSNDSLDLKKTGQFTQEAWIFANLTDDNQHGILGYENYPSIWIENQTTIKVGIDNNTFSVDNALNPNTWNHVATTFDGQEYKLYVNGVELYKDTTFTSTNISGTQQFTIGKVADSDNFVGAIDEVRLWDVARTQTEIQSYMLNSLKGSEEGLIGYWQFEKDFHDKTANANHGTETAVTDQFINNPAPQIGYVEVNLDKPFEGPQGLWVEYDITSDSDVEQNTDYFTSRTRRVSTDINTERNGIIIPKGETSARIYVSALNDAIVEGDENITITLRETNFDIFDANKDGKYEISQEEYAPSFENNLNFPTNNDGSLSQTERDAIGYNYKVGTNSTATITIKDNQAYQKGLILLDEYGQRISDSNKLIVDKDGNVTFQVKLTSQPPSEVTLNLSSGLGTLDTTSVTIQSSEWDTAKSVTLSGVTGTNVTNDITVNVNDPNYLTTGVTFPFTNTPSDKVRITEGSAEEAIPVTPVATISKLNDVNEGDIQPGRFIINLSAPAPAAGLSVEYQLTGSAEAGTDYNSINAINIAPGETSAVLPIYSINDDILEGNEQVTITLTSGLEQTSATLNIIDDEKARIQLSDAVVSELSLSFGGGINDYVEIPKFNNFPTTEITLEGWFKRTQIQGRLAPLFSYAVTGEDNELLLFENTDGKIRFDIGGQRIDTGITIADEAWHHWTVTWRSSDGQVLLYRDGEQVFSGTLKKGYQIKSGGSLVLGQEQDSVGGGFQANQTYTGLIKEVRVWNTIRSAEEIGNNINLQLEGDEIGLVSYYKADEGQGTVLLDNTANENNGTLNNGVSWSPSEYTYTGNFDSLVTSEPYPRSGDILQLFDEDGILVKEIPITQADINAGKVNISPILSS